MVTPVTNSYIPDLETASAYFASDPRATAFIATPATMTWYLQRATKVIDALPLRGRKYYMDGSQERQFPRLYRDGYDMDEATGISEVPQIVLDACCEEALAIYLFHADADKSARRKLQEEGVKAYSLGGGYSETFGTSNEGIHNGLKSTEAYALLSKYIARSFPIT